MNAGEMSDRFGLHGATTSRHLKVLAEVRLLTAERTGRERLCRVNTEAWTSWADGWHGLIDTSASGARHRKHRALRGQPRLYSASFVSFRA